MLRSADITATITQAATDAVYHAILQAELPAMGTMRSDMLTR